MIYGNPEVLREQVRHLERHVRQQTEEANRLKEALNRALETLESICDVGSQNIRIAAGNAVQDIQKIMGKNDD